MQLLLFLFFIHKNWISVRAICLVFDFAEKDILMKSVEDLPFNSCSHICEILSCDGTAKRDDSVILFYNLILIFFFIPFI